MIAGVSAASRRADARANHAALLEAATTLVAAASGEDVPYDDLAAAAGVSRATVYRHFPTREALFRAILDAWLDDWEGVAAQVPAGPGHFGALFEAWVGWQRDKPRYRLLSLPTFCVSELELRHMRMAHFPFVSMLGDLKTTCGCTRPAEAIGSSR